MTNRNYTNKSSGLFEPLFDGIGKIISCFLISAWISKLNSGSKYRNFIIELYILIQVISLFIFLFNNENFQKWFIYLVCGYWCLEIFAYPLWAIFGNKENTNSSLKRKIILTFVDYISLILIFANFYLTCGEVLKNKSMLEGSLQSIYFSSVTGLTIGYGDFTPSGKIAQALVVIQSIIFLGYILIFFGYYFSKFFNHEPNDIIKKVK